MLSLSDNFRATGRAVPTRNGALITALRRPRMARRRWSHSASARLRRQADAKTGPRPAPERRSIASTRLRHIAVDVRDQLHQVIWLIGNQNAVTVGEAHTLCRHGC